MLCQVKSKIFSVFCRREIDNGKNYAIVKKFCLHFRQGRKSGDSMRIKLYNELKISPTGDPADDFQPFLDVFLLKGAANPLGGVLVIPGGGYQCLGDYEGDPVAEKFNSLGFHAFVLNYRVAPYRYPAAQEDLVQAVNLIRANAAGWKLGKLAVLGFSAGAHLAASGAMVSENFAGDDNIAGKVDALILSYPVISLTDEFAHKGSGLALFGEYSSVSLRSTLNMQNHVTSSTPPAFLWHTADDDAVSVRNSLEFAQKMWSCGNRCELHVFPSGWHGRGLGLGTKDLSQWPSLAASFLETSAGFIRG